MKTCNLNIKNSSKILFLLVAFFLVSNSIKAQYGILKKESYVADGSTILPDTIIYHPVRVDKMKDILPWYSTDLGEAYDHIIRLTWNFWKNMEIDANGERYYMNHQIWRDNHDWRGIGGDQVAMAISSWDLLYNYLGDKSVIADMKYQADYYLANSLSSPNCKWPNLPYPYNTDVETGIYDGDMMAGKGILQPDKAGSFGFELVRLYKKTNESKYLDAAIKIANTMAATVRDGDIENSPWPFKVNATTGEVADLGKNNFYKKPRKATYTTNWTGTLELFSELIKLNKGDKAQYQRAFDKALAWMQTYPEKTNDWGPFFEDVPGYSKTQINATTYAMYAMEHQELFKDWEKTVNGVFDWVHEVFTNPTWDKYGVLVTNEQTAYPIVGNSHTARQGAVELYYWVLTGNDTLMQNNIRQLTWATYCVDHDGKSYYPTNDVWMTDGYVDFIRHYIRAMATAPQLAPSDADHMLKTSSIVQNIVYQSHKITYNTFDHASNDLFRLTSKPKKININGKRLNEVNDKIKEGWFWYPLDKGGILTINQRLGNSIEISK